MEVQPQLVVSANPEHYHSLAEALAGTSTEVACGHEAVMRAASLTVDWSMVAIVGLAGLQPAMQAVANASVVALANKECIVCAWPFIHKAATKHNTAIIPVDSEHNVYFNSGAMSI